MAFEFMESVILSGQVPDRWVQEVMRDTRGFREWYLDRMEKRRSEGNQ